MKTKRLNFEVYREEKEGAPKLLKIFTGEGDKNYLGTRNRTKSYSSPQSRRLRHSTEVKSSTTKLANQIKGSSDLRTLALNSSCNLSL